MLQKFLWTFIEIPKEIVWNWWGSLVGIRRGFIGINGEKVRMLRGIRIDCMGICTELKGNWREELLGNSCGSSANACGITGELVGTS